MREDSCRNAEPAGDRARWRQGFLLAGDRPGYDAAARPVRECRGILVNPLARMRRPRYRSSESPQSRLDQEAAPFGSAIYSVEEIVAEMRAAYLCGVTGIENRTIDNSAAYIGGWLT